MVLWRRHRGRHRGRETSAECGTEPTATEVTEQVRDGIAGDRMAAARVRRTADSLERRVDRENHIGAAMRELFGGLR